MRGPDDHGQCTSQSKRYVTLSNYNTSKNAIEDFSEHENKMFHRSSIINANRCLHLSERKKDPIGQSTNSVPRRQNDVPNSFRSPPNPIATDCKSMEVYRQDGGHDFCGVAPREHGETCFQEALQRIRIVGCPICRGIPTEQGGGAMVVRRTLPGAPASPGNSVYNVRRKEGAVHVALLCGWRIPRDSTRNQNLAVDQSTVSQVVTEVTDAILERLLP